MEQVRNCNFWKNCGNWFIGGVIVVIFALFLGWVQFTGQDWEYWSPLIHGGLMTLIGAGIGAWFGTLKTKEAAIEASTRQHELTIEKEQLALATEIYVPIKHLIMHIKGLRRSGKEISTQCDTKHYMAVSFYQISDLNLGKFFQLTFLEISERQKFLDLVERIESSISTLRIIHERQRADILKNFHGDEALSFLGRLEEFNDSNQIEIGALSNLIQSEINMLEKKGYVSADYYDQCWENMSTIRDKIWNYIKNR